MTPLVVVENPSQWRLDLPGVTVVSAKSYLLDRRFSELRGATVFNMCRSYRAETTGYYVSLLAAARGHKPLPSVETLQDMRISPLVRIVSADLEAIIARSLSSLKGKRFDLSVYFGRNVAKRYDRLSQALFNQFPAPFLRASFEYNGRWNLTAVRAVAASEIPDSHRDFVIQRAAQYFARPGRPSRPKHTFRYDLAILRSPEEPDPPSNERAIKRFVRAAERVGISASVIGPADYGRVAEFDALFIRATTGVNHYTYRFATRAAAEGLVVIDDPQSIVRCTNKVYQAELFSTHGIPSPRTVVVHDENAAEVEARVGLPCVLKRPDSAFSRGVVRVAARTELKAELEAILKTSELAIAQEYLPSTFDWRVGVLNRQALFVCKYHMARGHWQIVRTDTVGNRRYGRTDCLPLEAAPAQVLHLAVKSAGLIGDGLYGVDIKEVDGQFFVTEVNDNPNIDAGYEDVVLKDGLYLAIAEYFRWRLDSRGTMRGNQ